MSGIFGESSMDKYFENQLLQHLDDIETDEEEEHRLLEEEYELEGEE